MTNDDRRQVKNCWRDNGGFLRRDNHPGGQMPLTESVRRAESLLTRYLCASSNTASDEGCQNRH
jgi:hypothetical protein